MTASFDRDIGELRARMAAVETEMHDMRRDVREIRDALVGLRGGWKLLTLVIAMSASLGALAGKLLPLAMLPRP
jgi:CHAD domain-containing protein